MKIELSEPLQDELTQLLQLPQIGVLGQHLRRMFIDYLEHELQTGIPVYFDEFLYPLNCLFDFLEAAATGTAAQKKVNSTAKDDVALTPQQIIIQFIAATVSPEKIFLISHAKEKDFFDLLIVIPDISQTAFSDFEQVIAAGCISHSNIHFSLHQSGHINKQIEEGHIFYSLVCTRENLVYDDGMQPLLTTGPGKLHPLINKAKNEFNTGIKRAQSFLNGANTYHANNEKELTAFMLQQAAELAFRTVILSLTGQDIRTHSITVLKKHCKRCAPGLNEIFPANTTEEERLISLLDKAYLNARYSADFIISNADEALLLERVQLLLIKAAGIFKEKMALATPR
ncbi:MAG: hypothetical protein JWN83_1486 [Chitinophagaceae bacterium]|nr:hypothetical protein [Chitinophagaceae bacterium]